MTNTNVINANPTKDFFIRMLTKDIPLIRAIVDLVDNSVDGALRLRPNNNYSGLQVNVRISETEFVIEDNCGGIPIDVAQNYAFRFGRPTEAIATPNSVGLFGVGMKRAIFKMGNFFEVQSRTEENHFQVRQDIEAWRMLDEWEFRFEDISESDQNLTSPGTRIKVTQLYAPISEQFKLENFLITLCNQLEAAQQISLEKGLTIKVNDISLKSTMLYLYNAPMIKPGYSQFSLDAYPQVSVAIYTGIYERDLVKGGWYLFCNSRLVLFADQTSDTGWDDSAGLPKYHPDFAYSRGYVYFSSSDANLLPWNTTKTGVDTDSPIFKAVRQEMVELMRPVTKWLRGSLAEEKKEMGEEGELHEAIKEAHKVSISDLDIQPQVFSAPVFVKPSNPTLASIQYKVSPDRVERVRRKLGVKSNSEVGRETFDYYFKLECED
jgi:hypothetical protein